MAGADPSRRSCPRIHPGTRGITARKLGPESSCCASSGHEASTSFGQSPTIDLGTGDGGTMPKKWGLAEAFAHFGATGRNQRWSWSARSADGKTVVITLWRDGRNYTVERRSRL